MKYIIWLSCLFLFSCKSDEDAQLTNKWILNSYIKDSGSLVTNVSQPLYFTFTKENEINIELDVNTCSGDFTKSSEVLNLTNFDCTKACCDSALSITAYNLVVDSVKIYRINGKTLKLSGDYGTTLQLSLVE
jgi:hypothetical protein